MNRKGYKKNYYQYYKYVQGFKGKHEHYESNGRCKYTKRKLQILKNNSILNKKFTEWMGVTRD